MENKEGYLIIYIADSDEICFELHNKETYNELVKLEDEAFELVEKNNDHRGFDKVLSKFSETEAIETCFYQTHNRESWPFNDYNILGILHIVVY